MNNELFHSARLKIERAKKHIVDLHVGMREFLNKNSYIVYVELEPDGTRNLLKAEAGLTIPDEFLLIIGDALHNLRTALDFAMNDIEFTTIGKRTRHTKFPIYPTRKEFEAAVNGGLKEKAPVEVINFIKDVVQPYERGNGDAIWCLHELDIEDKHRLLIAKVQLTHIRGIRARDDKNVEILVPDWLVVQPHIAAYRCTGHNNVKVTDQGKAMFGISFGKGLPMQGQLILPSLVQLSEIVASTLDGVEKVFLASRNP